MTDETVDEIEVQHIEQRVLDLTNIDNVREFLDQRRMDLVKTQTEVAFAEHLLNDLVRLKEEGKGEVDDQP